MLVRIYIDWGESIMRDSIYRSFNWPNTITIVRIGLAFVAFSYALTNTFNATIIAMVIFTIAAVTDFLDGELARRYNSITTFGKILDPIADKVLVLGAFAVLSYLGVFPFWIVIPVFAREIVITIVRLYFLMSGIAIAAVKSGKQKTIMQITAIGVIFANLLFTRYYMETFPSSGLAISWALTITMYAVLGFAVWLTVYSGYDFFKNNWKLLRITT